MVLVPEVVDTVGPDVPVLAAGGIGRGRQMAAAMALGAQGAWTGSIWLTVRRVRHPAVGRREAARRPGYGDTVRSRADDRQARPPAAHRVDRGVGARGRARPAADAAPGHPLRARRAPLQPRATNEALSGSPVGQIIGGVDTVRPAKDVVYDIVEEWIETTQKMAEALAD